MDANELIRNCNAKSAEELSSFEDQWVAWSEDGRTILASAPQLEALFQQIERKGLTRYVVDHLPPAGEDFLGGMSI